MSIIVGKRESIALCVRIACSNKNAKYSCNNINVGAWQLIHIMSFLPDSGLSSGRFFTIMIMHLRIWDNLLEVLEQIQ